ncbi:MAG TPA: ABC transporter permease subunit, partial [Clostridia bacterium]|nr:ABC transporter permease subunit [Clostridia bacterium]
VSILCFGNAAHSGGGFEHSLKTLVLPFVSIALIPLLCLSHLVESFVIKEMDKDYVIAAKARGFASFEIASRHMIKGILAEAAKHIPEITVMVLSNLIAVEYIFGLPGLMNRLVVDIKNPETVFGIMLMTGAFCTVSVVFSKVFNSLLSPKGGCLHEE